MAIFGRPLTHADGAISVRCYAFERRGNYVAVCLDLCLAAQGDTMKEARDKLHDQVVDYVVDAAWQQALVSRPAPFPQWVRYYWTKLLVRIQETIHRKVAGLVQVFRDQVEIDAPAT